MLLLLFILTFLSHSFFFFKGTLLFSERSETPSARLPLWFMPLNSCADFVTCLCVCLNNSAITLESVNSTPLSLKGKLAKISIPAVAKDDNLEELGPV